MITVHHSSIWCVSFSPAEMLLRELTPTQAAGRLPSTKLMDVSENTACRCLFGRPSSDVSAIQAYLDEASRRRWNFDFAAMQPLPAGRFEWTSCTADTLPVPLSRSISVPLVVAAESPACNTGARVSSSTNIADNVQLSSVSCRLPGQRSPSPIPLPGNGYAISVTYFGLTELFDIVYMGYRENVLILWRLRANYTLNV